MKRQPIVCWFSCGAASAVATKLVLKDYPGAFVVYQDTGSEHPDNKRFLRDCEKWFGKSVQVIKSKVFADTWDVWQTRRYIAGIAGAPCTSELKRKVAEDFLFGELGVGTTEVFGYTVEEQHRVERYLKHNTERVVWTILIERGLTKEDCLGMIDRAGIELPEMYKLGYQNNNCIGCPKGMAGYWNKIRVDFPDVFDRMAKLERELNAAICKAEPTVNGKRTRERIFLDELDPKAGNPMKEPRISCGIMCEIEAQQL